MQIIHLAKWKVMSADDDDVGPAGSVVRAFVVAAYCVGEVCRLAFALLGGVLLRAEDYGLSAIPAVDAVDGGIEPFRLCVAGGIEIEKAGLDSLVSRDVHEHHSRTLVLVAPDERPAEALHRPLHYRRRAGSRRREGHSAEHAILWQVVAEMVGVDEHSHHPGNAVLHPHLAGAAGGIVGYVGGDVLQGGEHGGERARGAHALLRHGVHVVDGYAVGAVELLPRPFGNDVEGCTDIRLAEVGEVERRAHVGSHEPCLPPAPYAPHVAYGKEAESLHPLVAGVNQAAMAVARIAFGELACHLGEGLGARYSNADRHAEPAQHPAVQVLAPRLQAVGLHVVEHTEALVDGIAVELGTAVAHDVHQSAGHVGVELIVRREGVNLLSGKLACELEERRAILYAHSLGLVASRHHASVVVRQHDTWLPVQIRTERPLATDVAVVDVNQSHPFHKLIVYHSNQSPLPLREGVREWVCVVFGRVFFIENTTTPHIIKSSLSVTLNTGYFLLAGTSST